MTMFDYTGRIALITGAGQNVGAEVARTLAQRGATVIVNDVNADRASEVVAHITANGGRAVAAVVDVTDGEALHDMVTDLASRVGTIDILVNNAGIPASGIE
jgi:NAD(P)-dependent dehydrogenase (short-subunit alcohol dehydrogenase family)